MASASVSPATKRRAKPCFIPRRAMELVTLRLVESQKIKLRTSMNTSWETGGEENMVTAARRQIARKSRCSRRFVIVRWVFSGWSEDQLKRFGTVCEEIRHGSVTRATSGAR